jgi:hypothetical protein
MEKKYLKSLSVHLSKKNLDKHEKPKEIYYILIILRIPIKQFLQIKDDVGR